MTPSVAKTCFDAIRAKQSALAAGYDPMVVENQDVYEELLRRAVDSSSSILEEKEDDPDSKPKGKIRTRRQTPLVNAGYASRVLSVSYAIRSFVSYHKLVSATFERETQQSTTTHARERERIRIILLGCGVDVIGLWARSLLSEDDDKTIGLTIVEVDKPEVCSIKRKMIAKQGMVKNLVEHCDRESAASNDSATNYYTGTIVPASSRSSMANENGDSPPDHCADGDYDYVLIPGDLNDTSSLEPIIAFNDKNKQVEIPTLVVSELVLSYLPPSSTDRLLQWCADRLCVTSDSAFVSLEPIGSHDIATETSTTRLQNCDGKVVISVEEGYQRDYSQKFRDRMGRGRSIIRVQNKTASPPSNPLFHPIGFSTNDISSRLKLTGFFGTCTANLGVTSSLAAAFASNSKCSDAKTLVCPDVFDEHAALILHLQSYVLACGFVAPNKGYYADPLFRRLLCPWEYRPRPDLALARSGLPRIDRGGGGIVYKEIEVSDEASVRSLFEKTYGKDYTDEYPAIRKMVKGALNNDMRETAMGSMTTQSDGDVDGSQGPQNEFIRNSSAIGNFYRSSGGIFLVATKYTTQPFPEDKITDECSSDHMKQSKTIPHVVGCVGIRSYKGKEADFSTTLEIFRLAVDANHRGRGIGRNLLRSVEEYAEERQNKQRLVNLKFIANTLTILEDAAKLYENCGYRAERETQLGSKLVLRTYTKEVGLE